MGATVTSGTIPGMTADQIGLVTQSFDMVKPMSGQLAGLFYQHLFEIAPSAKVLFANTNTTRQAHRFMGALTLFVRALEHPDVFARAAAELGERHAGYGVKPADYTPFGSALIWALGRASGPRFDAETRAAWEAAYAALSGAMIGQKDAAHSAAVAAAE